MGKLHMETQGLGNRCSVPDVLAAVVRDSVVSCRHSMKHSRSPVACCVRDMDNAHKDPFLCNRGPRRER